MMLDEAMNIFRQTGRIKNARSFDRYEQLIQWYANNEFDREGHNFEKHHILPVAIFPEFKKENWNIILLPIKAHYIAHYLLFKSIRHKSCVFAFNQMRRISKRLGKPSCRLYAAVRHEVSLLLSQQASSRVQTDREKKKRSETMKRTNCYRNIKTLELKRFSIDTVPVGWEAFQNGRVRSEESKNELSKKYRGRKMQFNDVTYEVKYDHSILPGFTAGFPPWLNVCGKHTADTLWIFNDNGEVKRHKLTDEIPSGFSVGRQYNNVGFAKINNSNLIRVLDLEKKEFVLIDPASLNDKKFVKHGVGLDKIVLIQYNGKIFTTITRLQECYPELPTYVGKRDMSIENFIIPLPHHNQSFDRQQFCKQHSGKTFADIGIKVIPLANFKYNKDQMA